MKFKTQICSRAVSSAFRSRKVTRVLMRSALAAAFTLVTLGATSPDSSPAVTPDSLRIARAKWLAAAASEYEFSGRCNGWIIVKGHDRPWKIEVKGDQVTRAKGFDGFLDLKAPPTMTQIFDAIGRVIDSQKYAEGTVALTAKFDVQFGYPKLVYVEDTDMEDSWGECRITHLSIRRASAAAVNR